MGAVKLYNKNTILNELSKAHWDDQITGLPIHVLINRCGMDIDVFIEQFWHYYDSGVITMAQSHESLFWHFNDEEWEAEKYYFYRRRVKNKDRENMIKFYKGRMHNYYYYVDTYVRNK